MDRQGFDPLFHTFTEVLEFMERIEEAESYKNVMEFNKKDKKAPPHAGLKRKTSPNKYCILHGAGSHSTDQCSEVRHQIKKIKTHHHQDKHYSSPKYKNKTWSCKD